MDPLFYFFFFCSWAIAWAREEDDVSWFISRRYDNSLEIFAWPTLISTLTRTILFFFIFLSRMTNEEAAADASPRSKRNLRAVGAG